MKTERRVSSFIVILAIVVLIALGCIMIALSFMPFEIIKARMDAFAADGEASPLSADIFYGIINKLRLAGILVLVVGAALLVFRKRAIAGVANILPSLTIFMKQIIGDSRQAIRSESRSHIVALGVIMVVGIVMRALYLREPMRYDETATYLYFAARPLYLGLSYYLSTGNHLFNTLLIHISTSIFGEHPWAIRIPVFLAGVLTVPLSYAVARMYFNNKSSALLTAALVAVSAPLILYSANARGYSIVTLLFLLVLAIAPYLKRGAGPGAWLVFAVLCALGFYTVPAMLYPFGIVMVWLILSAVFDYGEGNRTVFFKRMVGSMILMGVLTVLLYSPVIVVTGRELIINTAQFVPETWSDFARKFPALPTSIWRQWNTGLPEVLKYALIVGLVTSLVLHRRIARHRIPLILAAAVWLIPVLLAQRVTGQWARVYLFLLPVYLAMASAGIVFILSAASSWLRNARPVLGAIVVIAISLFLSVSVVNTGSVPLSDPDVGTLVDADEVAVFLKGYIQPTDRVVAICPSDCILEYYFRKHGIPSGHLVRDVDSSERALIILNKGRQETLTFILNEAQVPAGNLPLAEVIWESETARVYAMPL